MDPEDSVTGCLFCENVAGGDGAAGCWSDCQDVVMKSCTVVGNSTLSGGTSALAMSGTVSLNECIIAFNSSCRAAPSGTAFRMVECTDIYGNEEGDWVGGMLEIFANQHYNFSLDPLFCDRPNRDYRLEENSPCAPANSGCGELVGSEPVGCQ